MYFSPKPLGERKISGPQREKLSEHTPAQSFRRSSRELAHSARIVYLSGPICRSDLAPKAETAETIEYFNIRRKEADDPPGKDVKGQAPLIFDRIFENTKLLGTAHIRKKY